MRSDNILNPNNRMSYSDILRPPPGYEFNKALATTYSMDLETALSIPAIIALSSVETRDYLLSNPLNLLHGIQRFSQKIAIFCEAGRIGDIATKQASLTALLEDMITEVIAPNTGVFHPKLWFLRFDGISPDDTPRLRLVILSRNMTKDRSWDISLMLDGSLSEVVCVENRPIANLIKKLAHLSANHRASSQARKISSELAKDINYAKWELPSGVDCVEFAVNGLQSSRKNVYFPKVEKNIGVISPFLTPTVLCKLTKRVDAKNSWLVSQNGALKMVRKSILDRFHSVKVLHENAEKGDGDDHQVDMAFDQRPIGIHAKVFITELFTNGEDRTRLTIGSGNATTPALISNTNVEVFAILSGPSNALGRVKDFMENKQLLELLCCPNGDYDGVDNSSKKADEIELERFRKLLSCERLSLTCTQVSDNAYSVALSSVNDIVIPDEIKMEVYPLTRNRKSKLRVKTPVSKKSMILGTLTQDELTPWLGIQLTYKRTRSVVSFVMGVKLLGAPKERFSRAFENFVDTEAKFLSYIQLLLENQVKTSRALSQDCASDTTLDYRSSTNDTPMLEDMVRSLIDRSDSLHEVGQLISKLNRDKIKLDKSIVSSEFNMLWNSFQKAINEDSRRD